MAELRPPWETMGTETTAPARPPRILVAMSAFKGTMSAREATNAAAAALRRAFPRADVVAIPVADGGGGTAQALVDCLGGAFQPARVVGPLGELVDAQWAALSNNAAAIEMASASGLALVPEGRRDPLHTTSFGTGQLIAEALDAGARRVMLGIGDSATVDGGLGASQALGAEFRRLDGRKIDSPVTGGLLSEIGDVDVEPLRKRLEGRPVEVLCDVDNPLVGERGAARVFGPQKGADERAVALLEEQLSRVYGMIEAKVGKKVRDAKGAGAAGGMGAAALALWNGMITSGSERLLTLLGINRWIGECDLVVVGEGRMDAQSLGGKASARIAGRAKARGVPVAAIVGIAGESPETKRALGLDYIVPLTTRPGPLPTTERAIAQVEKAAMLLAQEARGRLGLR